MTQVTIHQAKTHLSRLLQKVLQGEEVVIARGKTPIAKIVMLDAETPRRTIGSARGQLTIRDDFDAPIPDFEDYTR